VTVYGFEHADAKALLRTLGQPGDNQSLSRRVPMSRASGVWIMEATTAITDASGTTPGSGTAKLKWLNPSTGLIEDWKPNTVIVTQTIYTLTAGMPAGQIAECTQDNFGTIWMGGGSAGIGTTVRFSLDNALTTAEASNAATVDDAASAWDNESITVYNCLTSTASTYLFEGDSGDFGLCVLREDGNWWIVNMECP